MNSFQRPDFVPGPNQFDQAVERLLTEAVVNTERAISWARIFWGIALIAYSVSMWDHYGLLSATVSIVPKLVFILFSIYTLWLLRGGRLPRWLACVSVTVDCMVSTSSLLPNVLWPTEDYPGVINLIDLTALMISLFAAGFRLSTRVALWGTALSIVNFIGLMSLDSALNHHPKSSEWGQVILFLVFLAGCGALTVILARHTRQLAGRSAKAAVQSAMARRALDSVMQGHHDMKSMLTAATVGVDVLKERLSVISNVNKNQAISLAHKLQKDLQRLSQSVHAIKNEAFGRLMNLQPRQNVYFMEALQNAIASVATDYPSVVFDSQKVKVANVSIAGGYPVLERILFNLLLNACEGDGSIGGSHIHIIARILPDGDHVEVQIVDDGPGFAESMAGTSGNAHYLSRKQGGSGLGLIAVRNLLGDAALTLQMENISQEGACVSFQIDTEV